MSSAKYFRAPSWAKPAVLNTPGMKYGIVGGSVPLDLSFAFRKNRVDVA
jgi:hypothetical protein